MKSVVVIGAGQAAASFAAKFRSLDADTPLTIIGDEPSIPYQRPPLSKKYATGDMSKEQLYLRLESWYEEQNIQLKLGIAVTHIDREKQSLKLSDGSTIKWSKLLLTTGSRVRQLPAEVTNNLDGIHYLRTLEDADAFGRSLAKGKKVTIIGGGYIGLEAAAVCQSKGMNVTLVEASERILQRVACKQTSHWFRHLHQERGVEIIEGVGLSKFEGEGSVSAAVLADGTKIDTDIAIIGIGIIPNVELAQQAGLTLSNGIVVNSKCQTSDENIFAAGDCAVFEYQGEMTRLESVPNAIDQANIAAEVMVGNDKAYLAKPWFWSDQYDQKLQIAGLNRGHDQVVVRQEQAARAHFYYKQGQLISVDTMNGPRIYMISKRIIEAGKNITPQQAADVSFDLKSLI